MLRIVRVMVYIMCVIIKYPMEVINKIRLKNTEIVLIKGDLTEAPVDAIVNAANSVLKHGGGVAGAIVRKGGQIIQEQSDRIGFVPVGQCAITTGGNLPAPYVIHTVGPRWGEGDEEVKLRNAVNSTLQMASAKKFHSIALPAISAGIFGFPKDSCAHIMVEEIARFALTGDSTINEINIYLIDPGIIEFFSFEMNHYQKDQ
jgi:O-acetyl-ADP-ribose deacetylase